MLNLKNKMMAHQDFVPKELENLDFQTRDLAFKKILDEVMAKQRKGDMDMYKLYVQDHSYFQA
jgi:type I restriction enzyme R subunit